MPTARRFCLYTAIALLMATASAEAANWVPLSKDASGNTYYVDQTSVRRNGGALEVWAMTNYVGVSADGAMSEKTAFLLKCNTREIAVWSATDYSEPNGGGQIVGYITKKSREIAFTPVIPDTGMDVLLKFVCGRPG